MGFIALAASLTADALSTQKGLAYPGFTEMNPIARPFVQSRLGEAAYTAGGFGLLTGLMYVAHKTNHHKLERILPFAVGGWEGLLSARNYRVIANRPKQQGFDSAVLQGLNLTVTEVSTSVGSPFSIKGW
ncbi:MAG TPA: hypothetical protein VGH51_07510 [Candidatus Angelobacter sp.]